MRAAAFVLAVLTLYFIARHWGDSAHNRLLVDAGAIQRPKELTYFSPEICRARVRFERKGTHPLSGAD